MKEKFSPVCRLHLTAKETERIFSFGLFSRYTNVMEPTGFASFEYRKTMEVLS